MKVFDVIIIGAGPAGLTSAIYSARYKLNVLVIGKLQGGLVGETYEICNFPSYEKIIGFELSTKMINQVKKLGVEIKQEEVFDIKKNKNNFNIITNKEKYSAKKLVLAIGSERRRLQIENEKKFMGKGISYCATCDAGFYKNKTVGIIGGGDSALSTALLLGKFAKKVYIIYRQGKFFRAKPALIDEIKKNKNITLIFNSIITKLIGGKKLEEIEINNSKRIKINGLFIEIGNVPNIEIAEKLGVETEKNYIKVDKKQKTNVKGVFAAGDITNNPLKQIITACSEGAIAADSIYRELETK